VKKRKNVKKRTNKQWNRKRNTKKQKKKTNQKKKKKTSGDNACIGLKKWVYSGKGRDTAKKNWLWDTG